MDELASRDAWSTAWPITGDVQSRLNDLIGFFRRQAVYPGADSVGPTWDQLDDLCRLVIIDGLDPHETVVLLDLPVVGGADA